MPNRNEGKRWTWTRHKCECGTCKVCRNRVNGNRYYQKHKKRLKKEKREAKKRHGQQSY